MRLLVSCAFAIFAVSGHADADPDLGDADLTEDSFSDVVLVGTEAGFFCTGVVVAEHRVLTAGHCAHATLVGFGDDARSAQRVAVTARARHASLDVATLVLARSASAVPHPRRTRLDGEPPFGTVRIIGFGVRDRLRLRGFGAKRVLEVSVDGWGCTRGRVVPTGCNIADEMIVRAGDGNDTCLGDSGGPVFERTPHGWRLIAITSRGMRPRKVICGEGGIYVRVDRIDKWLEEVMQ